MNLQSITGGQQVGFGGFGQFSADQFMEVQKALEAGYPDPTYNGGGAGWPLISQSLEGTLTWATATEEHAALWRMLPKDPKRLTSTVHEFSAITDLGPDVDFSMPEGSAGPLIDADLSRLSKYVRFMSHKRQISDPMNLLSNLVGGLPALEQMNKWAAVWSVLRQEHDLIWGDSSVNPFALDSLKAETDGITDPRALRAILLAHPKPGSEPTRRPRIAQDSAAKSTFAAIFPNASPLRVI